MPTRFIVDAVVSLDRCQPQRLGAHRQEALRLHHPHHFPELFLGCGLVPLCKDGVDGYGHHRLVRLWHMSQHIAHEMHPAALPGSSRQHYRERLTQPLDQVKSDR